MASNNSALEQLKSFLNELFQFDSQDLDFGVYKILHYKRKEIKDFIDKLLVDKVKEQLQTLTSEESKKALQQLKDLEKDEFIQGWINATDEERKIGEKMAGSKVAEYRRVKTLVDEARVAEGTENHIYNHLTLFFSRYYDKGDFISKRRFGKNEKYVVPYNGEETHFYWANHDQYYIKSSETFQQYAFKITTPQDNMVVNFKLTSAQLEQGNVKADEPNFFILSEKEAEIGEKETNFFFEYRPLTDNEKKTFKGNNKQDVLNERAFETLKNKYGKEVNLAKLWETDKDDKALLLKKLNHYTRKNKYDFFIHKNLKGFLQRELDYYIKSELINVDDLYVSEVDSYFDRLKHNVKTIKVFKNIADTIIEFASQIEDFQKKLWEKKKFVLSTEWVITIDRLVEYIGEEEAKPILEEVIRNVKQVEEWKELFGEEIFKDWENINLSDLSPLREKKQTKIDFSQSREDAKEWLKVPIDTVHFTKEFKVELLNKLSEKIELEEKADGLILNTDNYHGIILLIEGQKSNIKCIHIDPPYNTATSGFLYKNTYEHSSWITMMDNRLKPSIDLLKSTASYHVHIDENEYERLHTLFDSYNLYNAGPIVWDKRNPMNGGSGLATQHEYIIWRTPDNHIVYARNKNVLAMLKKVDELIEAEGEINDSVRKNFSSWINSNKELSGGEKAYRYIDDEGKLYQSVSLRAPEPRSDEKFHEPLIHPVTKKPCAIPPNGFSRTPETLKDMIDKGEILFGKDESTQPRQKVLLKETTQRQLSTLIQDGKKGKADTAPLGLDFPYCHPTSLYSELIGASDVNEKEYVLDFFAGSGTTFHSVMILNKEDKQSRKCILIEQGDYVYTIINPRIKKIAYSFDWKDGKPKSDTMNGLGVFFKYQRLEQYEEALENIAFTANKEAQQQALEFDQYIPKYMLEFETKNSQTLVNTDAMKDPWDYKLKVWDGFTYDTEQAVDLVETFNYLIGLHMQKCITKEIDGNTYQFVYGHNNANKNILVVWRSVKDWKIEDYTKDREVLSKELENYSFDILYINEQAHLPEKYSYQPIEEVFKNKMLP